MPQVRYCVPLAKPAFYATPLAKIGHPIFKKTPPSWLTAISDLDYNADRQAFTDMKLL